MIKSLLIGYCAFITIFCISIGIVWIGVEQDSMGWIIFLCICVSVTMTDYIKDKIK